MARLKPIACSRQLLTDNLSCFDLTSQEMLKQPNMRIIRRWHVCLFGFVASLLAAIPPACAGWGKAKRVSTGGFAGLAVDSTGISQIVYDPNPSQNHQLIYTRFTARRTRLKSIVLPFALDISREPAVVTDAHNFPHVAVITSQFGLMQVMYLSYGGSEWSSQIIDSDISAPEPWSGTNSPLALDPAGNPHIAYASRNGDLMHAFFDGSAWNLENTGFQVYPYAMKIAPDGTIHVAGIDANNRVCERRDSNGYWSGGCFDDGNYLNPPSLAIRPDGSPEIAYGTSGYDGIKVASFNGSSWSTDSTIDAGPLGFTQINSNVFAIDPAGAAKIMFVGQSYDATMLIFGTESATGKWTWTDFGGGKGQFSISGLSLALDPVGLPRMIFGASIPGQTALGYGAETLPVLTDQWESIAATMQNGKTRVTGMLQVKNIGSASSSGFAIDYYLSADGRLGPSAISVGHTPIAIGAGRRRMVKFSFASAGPVGGEYLIAAIVAKNP